MNNQPHVVKPALPENTTQAVQHLIKITLKLIDFSERETQALLQNDFLVFSVIQDEKEIVANDYTRASEAFRARLHEFRSIDKGLLAKLDEAQVTLSQKANENNVVIERIKQRAETNTPKTLMTAQELAQEKPVHFEEPAQAQQGA